MAAAATNPALSRIPRVSLKQQVVEQIKAAIARNELLAGEQVTELGLARRLEVSQPTIREALIVLENQGFVERRSARKTFITTLSRQDVSDIYTVRVRLETLAAEILATLAVRDLGMIEAAYERMRQSAVNGDSAQFGAADLDFHRELWRATGNRTLTDLLERLIPKLFAFYIIKHADPSRETLLANADEHAKLLESIRAGDPKAAAKIMERSMREARREDSELLDTQN